MFGKMSECLTLEGYPHFVLLFISAPVQIRYPQQHTACGIVKRFVLCSLLFVFPAGWTQGTCKTRHPKGGLVGLRNYLMNDLLALVLVLSRADNVKIISFSLNVQFRSRGIRCCFRVGSEVLLGAQVLLGLCGCSSLDPAHRHSPVFICVSATLFVREIETCAAAGNFQLNLGVLFLAVDP